MDNLIRCRCPRCISKIKLPINLVGKRVKCCKCNYAFVADLAFSPVDPPNRVGFQPIAASSASQPATAKNRQPQRRTNGPSISSSSVPPAPTPPAPPKPDDNDGNIGQHDVPQPITYEPQQQISPTRASPGPAPKLVHFGLQFLLRWILPGLLLIVAALVNQAGRKNHAGLSPMAIAMFAPAVLSFFLSDFLARRLTAALAPTYRCPGCHSIFEAVGRWNCSCGYHDHKDQHFMLFRCPMCSKRPGHTNCRRCDATIFLQWGSRKAGR